MKKVEFQVIANGKDITQNFTNILTSITVEDNTGYTTDTASIVIDDTAGSIRFPENGAILQIGLGFAGENIATVFTGKVDEVNSRGARSSGKYITIHAKGIDTKGKLKQPLSRHFDDSSISEILRKAGNAAGITDVRVDDEIGSVVRKYELLDDESFLALGERLAKETGGVFKVRNNIASLSVKNSGKTPKGDTLPTIKAEYGVNLHGWDISPQIERPGYKTVKVRHYDEDAAEWKEVTETTNLEGVDAENVGQFEAPDEAQAKQLAKSMKTSSETGSSKGTITIEGNSQAQPDAECQIVNVRNGIDGTYRIDGVRHTYTRGAGFVTSLSLAQKL